MNINKQVIIEIENSNHLGDQIINFIFFYKIKNYIEENNIIIHYYCLEKHHKNVKDFNCSNNIKILALSLPYVKKYYVLWQGSELESCKYIFSNMESYLVYRKFSNIESYLVHMFNKFLKTFNIPLTVTDFEYEDTDLIDRYNNLENKYKDIDILIVNSQPLSGQYNYNKLEWDKYIVNISSKYNIAIATTELVNDNILSLHNMGLKDIAAISIKAKYIIAINTGPFIPMFNKYTLDNVTKIFLFGGCNFMTRKIICLENSSINILNM